VASVVAAAPPAVDAQDAHYWNNQYGTRAQLLGGLAVGSLVDLSATFYNPGAVAALTSPALNVGTDAWELIGIRGERLTEEDVEATSTRLRAVPSMFAISIPLKGLGDHGLTFSTLTRYNFDLSTDVNRIVAWEDLESGTQQDARAAELEFDTGLSEAWFGLTWDYLVHPKVGVGVTTYFALRSQSNRTSVNSTTVTPSGVGSATILTEEFRYTHSRLLWKIGVAADLSPVTLGLAVTTPGLSLGGSGRSFIERSFVNVIPAGGGDAVTGLVANRQDDLPGTYASPLSIALGATYNWSRTSLYFSTEWFDSVDDFSVVNAQDFVGQTTGDTVHVAWEQRWRSVINWGVGAEHRFSDGFRLFASFFTDRSAIEGPLDQVNLSSATWDIYHVNAGTALQVGSIELTIGLGYAWGADEDRDILGGSNETADFTYRSLRLLFGFGTL